MPEESGNLNSMFVTILIDPRTTKSFISPNSLLKCKLVAIEKNDSDQVQMASGQSQQVECLVQGCPLDLEVCVKNVNLYVMPLGHYYVIIGMDCLKPTWLRLVVKEKYFSF